MTMPMLEARARGIGYLAAHYAGRELPLVVCQSAAGFYIGTYDLNHASPSYGPMSRESVEYFGSMEAARLALKHGAWTQRSHP